MEIVPRDESTVFQPSGTGLTLLAETELALQRSLSRLRELYGDELNIGSPLVRYKTGKRLEEPYMGLRVLCGPQGFNTIRTDLERRSARVLDAELTPRFGVLRAEAPLSMLVGYPADFEEMSQGRGQLAMWLSHFAPVAPHSPTDDAA